MVVWWHTAYYVWFLGHYYFIVHVQKNNTFSFVSINSLLVYDRKDDMIRASLATTFVCNGPLLYESFIPSSSRSFICWSRDTSEPGIRVRSLRDWTLGTNMVAHPQRDWPLTPKQFLDGTNRSRWWKNRCRLSHPLPPPPHFFKSGASAPWFHFDSKFRCNIFGLGSLPLESGAVCCLKYKGTRSLMTRSWMTRNPVSHRWSNPGGWGIRKNWDPRI